jgi:hypothetical protein
MSASKHPADKQVRMACEILQHYHVDHTNDVITRFAHSSGEGVDIYLISDPAWKAKFLAVFEASVSGERPETHDVKPSGGVAKQ